MTTSSQKNRLLQFSPPPLTVFFQRPKKTKAVFIMGATGTGKSRLALDLSRHFPACEIINSDKMQFYHGLDITTNKVDTDGDSSDFRSFAGSVVADIVSRCHLPIVDDGSKSFLLDLLAGTLAGPESLTRLSEDPHGRIQKMGEILDGLVCEEAIEVPKPDAYHRKYPREKAQNTASFFRSGGKLRERSRIKQPRREPRERSKITRGGRKRG